MLQLKTNFDLNKLKRILKGDYKMIRITRATPYKDMLRAYKIFIDGVYRGDIRRNGVKEFEVENGIHTVCAKIDWCNSNELCVEVADSTVELEVGNAIEGKKHFAITAYITILKDQYLYLIKKEDVDMSQGEDSSSVTE